MPQRYRSGVPRWVAALVCGLGAALIIAGHLTWRAGRATRSYTRTRGRVVRAEVEESRRTSEEGGARFRPIVRYAFEVRGHAYESERISIGAGTGVESSDAQDARRVVERYPSGADVDVWFDPRDPARSVLVVGVPTAEIIAAVAIGIALVGIGMFILAR